MNGHVVGIIGASSTGLALARLIASLSIEVALAGSAEALELGDLVHAVTVEEAANPEIVVLTADSEHVAHLLAQVRNWDGRILVDATNPLTSHGRLRQSAGRRTCTRSPSDQGIGVVAGPGL